MYEVSVAQVMASQDLLNESFACRSENECPPLHLAQLLNREDLEELRDAWAALRRQAGARGGELLIRPEAQG
jgi:hypothetical protein